jgi:plastocyanin
VKTLLLGAAAVVLTAGFAPALTLEDDPVVQINGKAFQPARLEIKAGEKVTWKNYDLTEHTVTAKNKPALPEGQGKPLFDSGLIKPGASFSYRFEKEGTYEYACTIHPGMSGTIVVTPAK